MSQIIKNYLFILIVPCLIGAAVRFLCRRTKRAYLPGLVLTALAAAGWTVFRAAPAHGSELYGILALQATSAAAGALLTGLLIRLKGRSAPR